MKIVKFAVFLLLIAGFVAVAILIFSPKNLYRQDKDEILENSEQNDITDEEFESYLELEGFDSTNLNGDITEKEARNKEYTRTVSEYKTLAEAEEDMGYYLGFHNILESIPKYELGSMFNVGEGSWYQAIFYDFSSESDETPTITVKTSRTNKSEMLKSSYPYYILSQTISINNVAVKFEGDKDGYNLVSFDTPNNKSYTIYCEAGINKETMISLATELINNLVSMDDWVE